VSFLLLTGAVIAALVWYFMTAEERHRVLRAVVDRTATAIRASGRAPDDLHALLLERTRRPFASIACIAVCIAIWVVTSSSGGTAEALIAWGASYPPRTTNGEWWRLATYMVVHSSFLHVLATVAALLPLGMYLERLVGRLTFFAIFVAAGVVAATVALWTRGATVMIDGSSGAVFGLVGLLVAVTICGYVRAPRLPLSLLAAKRLAVGLGVFGTYDLVSNPLGTPSELAGMATGIAAGFLLARNVVAEKPPGLRSALAAAVAVAIAIAAALPLRGIVDARPFLARVGDLETQTAAEYNKAVDAYTHGRLSGKALAQLIERDILPPLETARGQIDRLRGVPSEQQPLLVDARAYFALRETSWHQRIDGLLRSKMKPLRDAERSERGALEVLERLQHNVGTSPG
jgi:rhomboid protease GluP